MCWLSRNTIVPTLKANFLEGEQIKNKGRSVDKTSLPHPWEDAVYFIHKYITCECWFIMVFNYHFYLLAHLCHGKLINNPYFLLESLKYVANVIRQLKHPNICVINQGLMKLIIVDTLEQKRRTWERLLVFARGLAQEELDNESKEQREDVKMEEARPSRRTNIENYPTDTPIKDSCVDTPEEGFLADTSTKYSHYDEGIHIYTLVNVTSEHLESLEFTAFSIIEEQPLHTRIKKRSSKQHVGHKFPKIRVRNTISTSHSQLSKTPTNTEELKEQPNKEKEEEFKQKKVDISPSSKFGFDPLSQQVDSLNKENDEL